MGPKLSEAVSFIDHSFRMIYFHVHPSLACAFWFIWTFLSVKNIVFGILFGEAYSNLQIFLIVFGSFKLLDTIICLFLFAFDELRECDGDEDDTCLFGFLELFSFIWIIFGMFSLYYADLSAEDLVVVDSILTISIYFFQFLCVFFFLIPSICELTCTIMVECFE